MKETVSTFIIFNILDGLKNQWHCYLKYINFTIAWISNQKKSYNYKFWDIDNQQSGRVFAFRPKSFTTVEHFS